MLSPPAEVYLRRWTVLYSRSGCIVLAPKTKGMHSRRLRDTADSSIADQFCSVDGNMAKFARVRRIGEANYTVFAQSRRFRSVSVHCVRFTDSD